MTDDSGSAAVGSPDVGNEGEEHRASEVIGSEEEAANNPFLRRRRRLCRELADERVAIVLPAGPLLIRGPDTELPYRPDADFWYLTGFPEPEAVAVIRPHQKENCFVLFVRPRDEKAELWTGQRAGPAGAIEGWHADLAHPLSELEEKLGGLIESTEAIYYRWGADERLDALVRRQLELRRTRGTRTGVGPSRVIDPAVILHEARLRKEPYEIERIRRAARITVEGFAEALRGVEAGMGEWEVEAALEYGFRQRGGRAAFPTIAAGGPRACTLHYIENGHRLEDDTLLLVDGGATWEMYCGDVTRTVPVGGRFTAPAAEIYDCVLAARDAAVEVVKPGVTIRDVHDAAVRALCEGLSELGLVGEVEEAMAEKSYRTFFPHQTSHWLGLDVHDAGDYARAGEPRKLEPGMVFTVEPGCYLPPGLEGAARHAGIGVRIEDDILVTEEGHEVLTDALPRAREEVESWISS